MTTQVAAFYIIHTSKKLKGDCDRPEKIDFSQGTIKVL